MSSGFYRKQFEQWWTYYFLKGLYGYTHEEMKELSDYRPAPSKIEAEKNAWYRRARKNAGPEDDQIKYAKDDENWDMSA